MLQEKSKTCRVEHKMRTKLIIALQTVLLILSLPHALGQGRIQNSYKSIHSGIAWFDESDQVVNAHGSCIVEEGGRYYLFGEFKTDSANVFIGFGCYSSEDLMNWKFERIVPPSAGRRTVGPLNRIGERVKVMKCPETGEFV